MKTLISSRTTYRFGWSLCVIENDINISSSVTKQQENTEENKYKKKL